MKITAYIAIITCFLFNITVEAQDRINPQLIGGCDTLLVSFTYTTSISPVTSVLWNFGNGPNDTSSLNSPGPIKFPRGIRTVTLVINGTTTIQRLVGLPRGVGYRTTFDFGSYSAILNAEENSFPPLTYHWIIPDDMPNQPFLIHPYPGPGVYPIQVLGDDGAGCIDTIDQQIIVRDTFIVPNVFTPNGDQFNDDFKIYSNGKDLITLKIFTRMGLMIYQQKAIILSWDGRLPSGEKALPGIYYYIVEKEGDFPVKQMGFFYLFL
jgi:gliding motility-associated-like protein